LLGKWRKSIHMQIWKRNRNQEEEKEEEEEGFKNLESHGRFMLMYGKTNTVL